MQAVYTGEQPPTAFSKSLFLAGPTPRSKEAKSWRPDALKILSLKGFDGVVFIPEYRDDNSGCAYEEQIVWEHNCLNMADCIMFWVPRELKTMPAFTTNIEFGLYANSGRVVFGAPPEAEKNRYLQLLAEKLSVPQASTLEETVNEAFKLLGNGSYRMGGETQVPLNVWSTSSFQSWYRAQKTAGNRLDRARVEFTIRKGLGRRWIYMWGMWVDIFVARENRHKYNETVLARPDISVVAMYRRAADPLDSKIVMVREFRSPAATADGFIWELPSGSSFKPNKTLLETAAEEAWEETGLSIDPKRLKFHGARQLAGTLSAHKAHVFSAELIDTEFDWLKQQEGVVHGAGDEGETGERTYVEIKSLREIMLEQLADWTTIGIILSVIRP